MNVKEDEVQEILDDYFDQDLSVPLRYLVDKVVERFDPNQMFNVKVVISRLTDYGFANMFWDEYKWYYCR